MPRTKAHAKYLSPTKSGTRAQIRIHGVLHRKHFPNGTDPVTIKQWLLSTEIRYRNHPQSTGRFRDDARTYLQAVRAMPSYAERRQHIDEWIALFGDLRRSEITPHAIRAQLQTWTLAGKAASTVNHRRTALMHLFTVLDGKSAANPVKDVPKFREPAPMPRGLSYKAMKKLFAAMPSGPHKARLMVIGYTGIPHAQLMLIQSTDVNLTARTVAVAGRKKGAGTRTRIVPLTPDGVRAFTMMGTSKAWGRFERWELRRFFLRACERLGLTGLKPYDLRHSFASEVYRRSGDIRATQILLDHSSQTLTHRYTVGATETRVQSAIRKFR